MTALIERRVHGNLEIEPAPVRPNWSWVWRGPWPMVGAGLVLALLNIATLLVAGHPWSITTALASGAPRSPRLWHRRGELGILELAGPGAGAAVERPRRHRLGHGISASFSGRPSPRSLAGKFAPRRHCRWARCWPLSSAACSWAMARGCPSLQYRRTVLGHRHGSLHGWLWFAAAFVGSIGGIALRPAFGLDGFARK